MRFKTFESYNKDKFIQDKIKSFYVDKNQKKKDFIDTLQMKLDFNTPKVDAAENPPMDVKIQSQNVIPTIPELEKKYKLFNKDGARKRFLQENYRTTLAKCAALSRTLKASGLPYLAKIVPFHGEKGDFRFYDAIIIYTPKNTN